MKFEELSDVCPSLFELGFLRQAFRIPPGEDAALAVQLSRWVQAGKLHRLRNGLYENAKIPSHFFEVANRLLEPSYISGAWALSYWGLIPDAVMEVTSAVGVRPRPDQACYENHHGRFSYTFTPVFSGYREMTTESGVFFQMAAAEKALVDWWCWQPGEWTEARHREARYQNVADISCDLVKAWAEQTERPRIVRASEVFSTLLVEIKEEENHGVTMGL